VSYNDFDIKTPTNIIIDFLAVALPKVAVGGPTLTPFNVSASGVCIVVFEPI
jgi:hypothetical protein